MKYPVLLMVALAGSLVLVGCNKSDQAGQQQGAAAQMPPAIVNVQPVQFQSIPLTTELSGKVVAYQEAVVTPQVSGIIEKKLFHDGDFVRQGQPLYQINADSYQSTLVGSIASYEQAKANIGTAEANINSQQAQLNLARENLKRYEQLKNTSAISKQEYDVAAASLKTAEAAVANAQAQKIAAQKTADSLLAVANNNKLNMSRTVVKAPMSGKTNRSLVNVGALATTGQTQMVTISQQNPIYVDISQSSAQILEIRQQMQNGSLNNEHTAQVQIKLADGTVYPEIGRIRFGEAKVDSSTGTVNLRAEFSNDSGVLLPGMMVTAQIIKGVINNAVLLPQSAITRTPKGEATVYIVDNKSKTQVRPVTLQGTYQGQWIVTSGLKAGEQVVMVGGAKVKPDQQVKAMPYVASTTSATPMNQPVNNATANPNASVASTQAKH